MKDPYLNMVFKKLALAVSLCFISMYLFLYAASSYSYGPDVVKERADSVRREAYNRAREADSLTKIAIKDHALMNQATDATCCCKCFKQP